MRHLFQPHVLNRAALAAAATALACYPRLSLWQTRPGTIGFLEANLFVCALVFWSFVFAWRVPYTGKPAFAVRPDLKLWGVATLAAVFLSVLYHFTLDPWLRPRFPQEYPADWQHWLAQGLFTLALGQLFLVFAPCDWTMRLVRNRWVAIGLTGILAAGVQAMKIHKLTEPISPGLEAALLLVRILGGGLAVWFYLRGGVFLVWWCSVILQLRLLLDL